MTEPTKEEEAQELAPVSSEVIEELERIAKNDPDGLIQAEAVVEVASNEDSPLHRHFEWDDDEAAYEWRLHQARNLIRSVRIVKTDPGPRFVNVTIKRVEGGFRRGYVQTERAVADPDLYEQVVNDTMKIIRSLRGRLSAFSEAQKATKILGQAAKELEATKKGKNNGK